MKFNLKNVFLSVGIFAFTLALVGALSTNKAEANTCTMTTGTWDGVANLTGAANAHGTTVFSGCAGGTVFTPATSDIIEIPTGVVLTITANATVGGIIIDSAAAANGITINTGVIVTDAGSLAYTANAGTATQTIRIDGNGALSVGTTTVINAPSSTGSSILAITANGTLTTTGTIGITGSTGTTGNASITVGAGTLNASGAVTITGATGSGSDGVAEITVTAGGTIHVIGVTALTLAGSAKAKLTSTGTTSAITIGGDLVDTFGTVISTGTTAITGVTTLTDGSIAINSGTYSSTGASTVAAGKTLAIASGAAATFNTTLAITGAVTNAGTLTVTGVLSGGGALTNTGTLNLGAAGAALTVTTLTAGTSGTVNYLAGNQTVLVTGATVAYYNLTLSGGSSAVKTVGVITGINNFSIATATSATLTGASTTKYLVLNGIIQTSGSWGGTNGSPQHINNTYFTSTGTGKITASASGNYSTGTTITTNPPVVTVVPPVTTVVCTLPQVVNTTTNTCVTPIVVVIIPEGCSAGNLYNTNTGAACINNSYPQGCSGGNLFNTSTGNACVNNLIIPGCGNRNTGFSVSSGLSCVGNHVTTATYNFGTTTLKNGSRGAAVMELQRFLNAKLFLGLVVDGKLGPKTIAVIKTWQRANGLVADGLVGALTKAKMHLME